MTRHRIIPSLIALAALGAGVEHVRLFAEVITAPHPVASGVLVHGLFVIICGALVLASIRTWRAAR